PSGPCEPPGTRTATTGGRWTSAWDLPVSRAATRAASPRGHDPRRLDGGRCRMPGQLEFFFFDARRRCRRDGRSKRKECAKSRGLRRRGAETESETMAVKALGKIPPEKISDCH